MSVSIIACPSCNTLLLPDTAQCPTCHHVLIEVQRPELGAIPQSAVDPNDVEDACPGCNELVRRGLVRCWNCGTFMKQEIAETYQRMQATPSQVIYSDIDENAPVTNEFEASSSETAVPANDVDFELAPDVADDDDFDTSPATYSLQDDAIVAAAPDMTATTPPQEIAQVSPATAAKAAKRTEKEKESKTQIDAAAKKKDAPAEKGSAPAKSPAANDKQEFISEFDAQFGLPHAAGAGGDALLQVALAEEAETGVRRRRRGESGGSRSGFVVYCPHGHRVEVQERHRGLTGRCPRCREPFAVPANPWDDEQAAAEAMAAQQAAAAAAEAAGPEVDEISAGEYTNWMTDVHHHTVNLTKLKLKPGSLLSDFQEADLAFSPNGMLKIFLVKKGGLFGGAAKKKESTRKAVTTHLSEGKDLDSLPGAAHQFYDTNAVSQIRIVQPIASQDESMFAGVPVFGEARIAVRFPKVDNTADPQFASFWLSEFRKFAGILEEYYGVKRFGADAGIPLGDVFTERVCHFSEEPLKYLENVDFYLKDPGFKLKLIGRRCEGCGLVVSEPSREKEKIGGKNGAKIAKAKCPKCEKPFGDISLYAFDDTPPPVPAPEKSPEN